MSKKISKKTNRIISVLCLSVFGLSLVVAGVFGGMIYHDYQENQKLKEQLVNEYEYLQSIYQNVGDDGYYNVYSDGEMVVYGNGGTIIIDKN